MSYAQTEGTLTIVRLCNHCLRPLAAVALLALGYGACPPLARAHPPAAITEVLRVGWSEHDSGLLHYENQDGVHTGPDPATLQLLALAHGLTLSYLRFGQQTMALSALEAGQIDAIADIPSDRADTRRYWLSPVYAQPRIGIVRKSSLPVLHHSGDLGKYRIACEANGVVRQVLEQRLPGVQLTLVSSPQEGIDAAAQGRADVYVGLQAVNRAVIAQLGMGGVQSDELSDAAIDLHFVTRKTDRHSIAVIENGLARLTQEQRNEIEARWLKELPAFPVRAVPAPDTQTQAWLREHKRLRVGVYSFREPYDFIDADNHMHGVGAALLRAFAIRYQLQIEPVILSTFSRPFDGLASGRVDVVVSVPIHHVPPDLARTTGRYDAIPWLLVRRAGRQPATPRMGAQLWRLPYLLPAGNFPPGQWLGFDTSDDAADALLKGEIDAAFINLIAANGLGTALRTGAAVIDRRYTSTEDIGYAVNADNAALQQAIDAFLRGYTADQLSEIVRLNHPAPITIGFDPGAALRIAAPLALGLVVLFTVLTWANIRIRKSNRLAQRARVEADQARRHAELADRAKSTFLATMSHEIRTPMNGIVGVIDILHATVLSPQQRHYLEVAQQSTRLLLRVINDILDLSKIEAGHLVIAPAPIDIYALSDNLASLYQAMAGQQSLGLYFCVMPHFDRKPILDEVRLVQIISNLVSNAIRFTDQGHVLVRLRAICNTSPPTLHIQVSDTGKGMSLAYLDRLFEPFIQEDSTTTRRYGGTGLGLSIVKRLVELMQGTIAVASRTGAGTRFDIRLPFTWDAPNSPLPDYSPRMAALATLPASVRPAILAWLRRMHVGIALSQQQSDCTIDATPDGTLLVRRAGIQDRPLVSLPSLRFILGEADYGCAREETTIQIAMPQHTNDEQDRSTSRILVVEDNDINREIITQQLRLMNFETDTAADGEQALLHCLAHWPAVLLVDCQMPRMDGFELTRRLRALELQERKSRALVIAITANASSADERRCLDAGMDDFLPKPLTRSSLLAMLTRHGVPVNKSSP